MKIYIHLLKKVFKSRSFNQVSLGLVNFHFLFELPSTIKKLIAPKSQQMKHFILSLLSLSSLPLTQILIKTSFDKSNI